MGEHEHERDPGEREIEVDTWVVDRRHGREGRRGVVTRCRQVGPGGDPSFLAAVLWVDGTREHRIDTFWLANAPVAEEAR